MRIEELDYVLPASAIATQPAEPRDQSRLMVYHRAQDRVEHHRFCDLPGLLDPADLLILNDTKVLPAKLLLKKATGAFIPGLFISEESPGTWRIMLRSRGKLAVGACLESLGTTRATFRLLARGGEKGQWIAAVDPPLPAPELLERVGHVPLPPYIEKARSAEMSADPAAEAADRVHYQTIYAQVGQAHSLAAPTAGLHFTPQVFAQLAGRGIRHASVTLHVGLGTFLPVETATLEEHKMHTEPYTVPAATVEILRRQRAANGRIVVVGTTATRTLESASAVILDTTQPAADITGTTDLRIQPGFRCQLTDVLLTNFHLPRSTLLALVAALIGLEKLKALYQLAIRGNYRFYSYGDAMLILP